MGFKIKKSYYSAPTPKTMRKLGDGFLAAGVVITLGGVMGLETLKQYFSTTEIKWMLAGSITALVAGKFLTNFFKEDAPKS